MPSKKDAKPKQSSVAIYGLRPRHYAVNILKIKDREARNHYLAEVVPSHYRAMVERYVRMWWHRRREFN